MQQPGDEPESDGPQVGGPNDGGSPPPDPFKAGMELAVLLHLHFEHYQAVGFDSAQAIYLCGQTLSTIVASTIRPPS